MIWDECNIVKERRNRQTITETTLMQHVISSVLSGQKGHKGLQKAIASINIETVPIEQPVDGPGEGLEWRGGM